MGWESCGEQDRAEPLSSFFLEEPDNKPVNVSSNNKAIIRGWDLGFICFKEIKRVVTRKAAWARKVSQGW